MLSYEGFLEYVLAVDDSEKWLGKAQITDSCPIAVWQRSIGHRHVSVTANAVKYGAEKVELDDVLKRFIAILDSGGERDVYLEDVIEALLAALLEVVGDE